MWQSTYNQQSEGIHMISYSYADSKSELLKYLEDTLSRPSN